MRIDTLTFEHHQIVAPLPDEQAARVERPSRAELIGGARRAAGIRVTPLLPPPPAMQKYFGALLTGSQRIISSGIYRWSCN